MCINGSQHNEIYGPDNTPRDLGSKSHSKYWFTHQFGFQALNRDIYASNSVDIKIITVSDFVMHHSLNEGARRIAMHSLVIFCLGLIIWDYFQGQDNTYVYV